MTKGMFDDSAKFMITVLAGVVIGLCLGLQLEIDQQDKARLLELRVIQLETELELRSNCGR